MKFYFISANEKDIQGTKFIEICVLNFDRKVVLKIYKTKNDNIVNLITHFKRFDEITEHITFAIRNNGKIVLDIK